MQRKILIISLIGILLSCEKAEYSDNLNNSLLLGKWKLVEVLADPGDGSGTYQAVYSNKIIEFHDDFSVTSNGSLCDMSLESDNPSTGIYSIIDSTITASGCGPTNFVYHFVLNDDTLIIQYPCFEPCGSKFVKL